MPRKGRSGVKTASPRRFKGFHRSSDARRELQSEAASFCRKPRLSWQKLSLKRRLKLEDKNTTAAKKIEIEFLYLDLDVCTRCKATDANLETARRTVQSVLEASGTIVKMRKALVDSEDMARRLKFVSSPTIRVNGWDIAVELHETLCNACTDACGCNGAVNCRVWLHGGKEYNEAPVPLIVNAFLTEVYGTQDRVRRPVAPEKFVLPDNLKRFFAAKEMKETSCCSDEDKATCCTSAEKGVCCDSVEQASAVTCGCK
jgi:Domain of unknown function (DUF2703)